MFKFALVYKVQLRKTMVPRSGWYRSRIMEIKKAGVCCIANTGSTFSFTFPEVLVIFGRRGLFFAAETVRTVIIARKIIKRIGCKKIHHIVFHICCSPL